MDWVNTTHQRLELRPMKWMQLRMQIDTLFSQMREQTRENYYKLCENFYLQLTKQNEQSV